MQAVISLRYNLADHGQTNSFCDARSPIFYVPFFDTRSKNHRRTCKMITSKSFNGDGIPTITRYRATRKRPPTPNRPRRRGQGGVGTRGVGTPPPQQQEIVRGKEGGRGVGRWAGPAPLQDCHGGGLLSSIPRCSCRSLDVVVVIVGWHGCSNNGVTRGRDRVRGGGDQRTRLDDDPHNRVSSSPRPTTRRVGRNSQSAVAKDKGQGDGGGSCNTTIN